MKHAFKKTTLAASLLMAGLSCSVQAANLAGTDVKFSGYIKADAMVSDYSDGTIGAGSVGRDFYIPSLTPIGGNDEGAQFDAHIRQSRFRFTTNTDDGNGDTITGVLEFDFMVTNNGDERISNSYVPRIRHAFIKYKNWTIGETWTTFMDVGSLPESLDFIGVTDGTVFGRQALIRYSNNGFEFALENPETTITPFGGGSRIVADDNAVPDVIATYKMNTDWGYVKVAGLVRQLSYDDGASIDSDETSYGISVSSKINLSNGDDIRLLFNTGSGLGRYAALNAANGAVINASGELEAIDSYGYTFAYRHKWSENTRSSVMFSSLSVDNDTALTGMSVTKTSYSARVNLIHSPTKAISYGAEYAFAKRENEAGADGDMNRIQFSAKYAF